MVDIFLHYLTFVFIVGSIIQIPITWFECYQSMGITPRHLGEIIFGVVLSTLITILCVAVWPIPAIPWLVYGYIPNVVRQKIRNNNNRRILQYDKIVCVDLDSPERALDIFQALTDKKFRLIHPRKGIELKIYDNRYTWPNEQEVFWAIFASLTDKAKANVTNALKAKCKDDEVLIILFDDTRDAIWFKLKYGGKPI